MLENAARQVLHFAHASADAQSLADDEKDAMDDLFSLRESGKLGDFCVLIDWFRGYIFSHQKGAASGVIVTHSPKTIRIFRPLPVVSFPERFPGFGHFYSSFLRV